MLNHIGLSVNNKEEIEVFYKSILGFKDNYNFTIPGSLSEEIFGIADAVEVYNLVKDKLVLEIFIKQEIEQKADFSHLCISVESVGNLIEKLKEKGYLYKLIERPNKTMFFAYDNSGNIFEIKEG